MPMLCEIRYKVEKHHENRQYLFKSYGISVKEKRRHRPRKGKSIHCRVGVLLRASSDN